MEILKTVDLTKHYYCNNSMVVKAVDNVNISIKKGEYVSVVGQSGAGKSTLLNLLGGLDKQDFGKVFIKGISIYDECKNLTVFRRQNVGFIFQAYNLIPFLNVWENIILPVGVDGRSVDKAYTYELLESLELSSKKNSFPEELSGGQQQRVAIARALIMKPSIVLADEPTGNLDSRTVNKVFQLLLDVCRRYGQTLVIVTHNEMIAKEADTMIRVVDGTAVIE